MREIRFCVPAPAAAALLVFAALSASPAFAQQVYKCSDGKGSSVYQQVPCAGASQQQDVREYAREPAPPLAQEATTVPAVDGRYPGRRADEQSAQDAAPARRPPLDRSRTPEQQGERERIMAAQRSEACQEARDEMRKQLARVDRTVSVISAAEAKVRRACL